MYSSSLTFCFLIVKYQKFSSLRNPNQSTQPSPNIPTLIKPSNSLTLAYLISHFLSHHQHLKRQSTRPSAAPSDEVKCDTYLYTVFHGKVEGQAQWHDLFGGRRMWAGRGEMTRLKTSRNIVFVAESKPRVSNHYPSKTPFLFPAHALSKYRNTQNLDASTETVSH